jgi:hypothetical protein
LLSAAKQTNISLLLEKCFSFFDAFCRFRPPKAILNYSRNWKNAFFLLLQKMFILKIKKEFL